jgi:hypothetical protein
VVIHTPSFLGSCIRNSTPAVRCVISELSLSNPETDAFSDTVAEGRLTTHELELFTRAVDAYYSHVKDVWMLEENSLNIRRWDVVWSFEDILGLVRMISFACPIPLTFFLSERYGLSSWKNPTSLVLYQPSLVNYSLVASRSLS